ncbi:MAG TPA: NAD(P)/FAD-dependent oxidoreductase [Candidatus Nanoarchaeia archaeon]|nr:NAD(P)/FAD-dependent oxidoreductase [Candidatus Nanoarchaeia archaeon]
MKRILILGAGFGGVYTALYLLKNISPHDKIEVTLLSKTNYFLFSPMLHEVATGGINRSNIVQPIREIICHPNFRFLRCTAKEINVERKIITTEKTTLAYDYLVIALGSENEFFNIPGAEEHAFPLKSLQDAVMIKNHVLDCLEYTSAMHHLKRDEPNLTFVIVGGGPTGVELAGELAEFIDQNLHKNYPHLKDYERKIYLIQQGADILPFMSQRSRQEVVKKLVKERVTIITDTSVTKVSKEYVEVNHKTKIATNTVIWASGIKPAHIATKQNIKNERGYFTADKYLRLQNQEEVFAIGDCSLVINPYNQKPTPALAQVAVRQAKIAAKNIMHSMRNESLETFLFKPSGILVSVGKRFAVADIHGLKFKGFVAWWFWRTIYLSKLVGFRNKLQVAYDWTLNLFFPRDTTQI